MYAEEQLRPFSGAYYTYDGDNNMVKSEVNGITPTTPPAVTWWKRTEQPPR